jgi:DNA-directed RNA polymerase specialized sigma24 family protein
MKENYGELLTAASRISNNSDLSEELLHFCLEEFLKKKDCLAIVDSGGGRFYIVRILLNQWRSTTSEFFHTYRKHNDEITEEYADEVYEEDPAFMERADAVRAELARLPWYDQKLFETFVSENHTVSSLARATQIPRTSVSLTINRIRRHVRTVTEIKPKHNEQTNQMEIQGHGDLLRDGREQNDERRDETEGTSSDQTNNENRNNK